MAFSIHKPGQGYWTRMLSAIGGGTLVLASVFWLIPYFGGFEESKRAIIVAIVGPSIILVFGALGWFLLNHPRIVDFMIATEGEMRKVNWPNRRQIGISTWVVICGTIMMAALLFCVDIIFTWMFKNIGILG